MGNEGRGDGRMDGARRGGGQTDREGDAQNTEDASLRFSCFRKKTAPVFIFRGMCWPVSTTWSLAHSASVRWSFLHCADISFRLRGDKRASRERRPREGREREIEREREMDSEGQANLAKKKEARRSTHTFNCAAADSATKDLI
jgi:hypothetical protein